MYIQIITMRWTMTASGRRVHEHLARELRAPKRGVPSLEEAHWEALRCSLKFLMRSEIKLKPRLKAKNMVTNHTTPRVGPRLGEQLDTLHTTQDLQGQPSAGEK